MVTAAKNALPALRQTVASLATQSNREFEHIIVDGGSVDGTPEWLESQQVARWVSEPDEGIADALNKGFRIAVGEFVLVLQAGDAFLASNSVDEALDCADSIQPADILAFDTFYDDERCMRQRNARWRLEWKPLHHQGVLFRRSLFELIGPFDVSYRICMDYEFLLRAKRRGAVVRGVPNAITRMNAGGISSRRDWVSLRERLSEERRVHLTHSHPLTRYVYLAYWPLYMRYKKLFGTH